MTRRLAAGAVMRCVPHWYAHRRRRATYAKRGNADHVVSTSLAFVAVLFLGLDAGEFAGQPGAKAHTYYVDASHGDDAHDGLTSASAWRSLTRVNQATLLPGDRVLFRRGETWRGQIRSQSGSAAGAIVYGAYGDGEKPLVLGSVAMHRPGDWQPAGTGLWATAPIHFSRRDVCADLEKSRWWLYNEGGAVQHDDAPGRRLSFGVQEPRRAGQSSAIERRRPEPSRRRVLPVHLPRGVRSRSNPRRSRS